MTVIKIKNERNKKEKLMSQLYKLYYCKSKPLRPQTITISYNAKIIVIFRLKALKLFYSVNIQICNFGRKDDYSFYTKPKWRISN